MNTLKNKVALITGSAAGLGREIAERYASLGADIIINYFRDIHSAYEVVNEIMAMGVRAVAIQADVSKVADLQRLFVEAKSMFGKIDIVVANAGIEMMESPVLGFTEEQFDRLFSTNTKGSYFTLQQAARHVSDNGRIIYIASNTTAFPVPGMPSNGGSKKHPRYWVNVMSQEIDRGIIVNSIMPFAVGHSSISADPAAFRQEKKQLLDSSPMGRQGEVQDVADAAEFFASDFSSSFPGQHLLVDVASSN